MPTANETPRWAIPFLAAHLVATSKRHRLRQLDDSSFRRVARACDHFMLGNTIPGIVVAAFLLPGAVGMCLLLGSSTCGIVITLVIGRRVALDRRRRAGRHLAGPYRSFLESCEPCSHSRVSASKPPVNRKE